MNRFYIRNYILDIQLNLFHTHCYIQLNVIFIHSSEAPGCQPFPCCPENSTSVFLTEGPYISEVKDGVNVDHVIRNRVVVIETIIKIPKLLNISKGNRIVECGMMYWFCYIFIDLTLKNTTRSNTGYQYFELSPPLPKKINIFIQTKSKADVYY